MSLLLVLILTAVLFGTLAAAAVRWGVDTRSGSNDPHQPERGLFVR
jgi:hypothetical protein